MSARRPPSRGPAPEEGGRRPPARGGPQVAPLLSLVGLAVIAAISFQLLGGSLPVVGVSGGGGPGISSRTPDPIVPFTPPQKPQVLGTILFVKAGNVWSVSGSDQLTQISRSGTDSSPVWSPDGALIYFVQTKTMKALMPCSMMPAACTGQSPYTLQYPVISSMRPDGTGRTAIASGLYALSGGYHYFTWLLQPAISPDGRTFALIGDAPDPLAADALHLETMPVAGGTPTVLNVPEEYGMGHSDPAWSPDGRYIAFTYNHVDGALGMPKIGLYNVATRRTTFLTGYGFAQPAWSPDGKYIAAVQTSAKGRDVVILNASTGDVVLHLTSDGTSFAPVWSPAGNQIAFLRASGLSIDLELATLTGSAPNFTRSKVEALTTDSELDGTSKPAWFIPADQMPAPSAAPAPAVSGAPGASRAAGSSGATGTP